MGARLRCRLRPALRPVLAETAREIAELEGRIRAICRCDECQLRERRTARLVLQHVVAVTREQHALDDRLRRKFGFHAAGIGKRGRDVRVLACCARECCCGIAQLRGIEFRHGTRRLVAVSQRVLDSARVLPYSTDPAMTRGAIAEAALATGNVTVASGIDVTEVLRDEPRVVGVSGRRDGERVEYRARLVVGDDGAHSVVREAIGGAIELSVFPLDFVTAAMNARPTFIPADKKADIIAHTELAGAGETVEVTFKVPAAAGDYPYICSFPGHYQAGMKGTLTVK